jgi:hypothetical protein
MQGVLELELKVGLGREKLAIKARSETDKCCSLRVFCSVGKSLLLLNNPSSNPVGFSCFLQSLDD